MTHKYNCFVCNYLTDRLSSYKLHLKTKKHLKNNLTKNIQNTCLHTPSQLTHELSTKPLDMRTKKVIHVVKPAYTCKFCDASFSRKDNMKRHLDKICPGKKLIELEEKYKRELEDKVIMYQNIINEKNMLIDHKNDLLEAKKEHLKDMKKTISFERKLSKQQFLEKYLPSNPVLEELEDYGVIHKEYKEVNVFCNDLIYYHKKKKLHSFLGDFLVSQYCKKNLNEQSLFASDVSRTNFLVSNFNKKSKKSSWTNDKKGIIIANRIIDPLLDYIYKIMLDYSNDTIKIIKYEKNHGQTNLNYAENLLLCEEIIGLLNNKSLKTDMVKHIAPYFDIIQERIMNVKEFNLIEDK